MKRKTLAIVLLGVLALTGCEKAVWRPLWSTPMPGRTPAITASVQASASPGSTQGANNTYFKTDAQSMEEPKVVVNKAKHQLELYDGDKLMARLQIALGAEPVGAKLKDGDNKTPEGDYYICTRNANSKFKRSMCISYPNEDDALRALDEEIITQNQYGLIADAIDKKKTPLWNTDMGGQIAIHGYGEEGKGKTGDWTVGNIAVSDEDIDYLWKFLQEGTEVRINP